MSFAIGLQGNGSSYGSGSLACAAFNVAAGELIVVAASTRDRDTWCTGVTDTAGNSYTVRSAIINTDGNCTQVMAYCLSSALQAGNIITCTYNNADNAGKQVIAAAFTPDGGDTVSLDASASAISGWEASPWETGTFTTTGNDEVGVAGVQCGSNTLTYSNHEMPSGTAAVALTGPGNGCDAWYKLFTSTQSSIVAEIDPSASQRYAMEVVCFKSVAAAGGLSIPIARRRGR